MARRNESPLKGAAPSLRPSASPTDVRLGARPPVQASPLLELGNAFQSWIPELRGMLRDAAAREDRDAIALAEIDAEVAAREGRLGEIEEQLKKAADSGQMPHRALPAYERAYRAGIGVRLADGLQVKLLENLDRAAKDGDADSVIQEVLPQFAEKIAEGDFYGRQGFHDAASKVIAQFRQQVAAKYAHNYQQNAEYIAAQEGNSLVHELATSLPENEGEVLAAVKAHLDRERTRLNPHEVNRNFLVNSVKPALDSLIAERRYDEARAVMERLQGLDITGKGGLLGKTTEAQELFASVEAHLLKHEDAEAERRASELQAQKSIALNEVTFAAARILEEARKDGFNLLASDIDREVQRYADSIEDDGLKAFRVQEMRRTLQKEIAADRSDRYALFQPEIAALRTSASSLVPEQLEAAEEALKGFRDVLPSTEYASIYNEIQKNKAQSEVVSAAVQRAVFAQIYRPEVVGGAGSLVPYFEADPEAQKAWDSLTYTEREEHQSQIRAFILDELRKGVAAYDSPELARTNIEVIKDDVTRRAQAFSSKLSVNLARDKKERDAQEEAARQAAQRYVAERTSVKQVFDLAYTTTVRAGWQAGSKVLTEIYPASPSKQAKEEAKNLPPSERDVVRIHTRSSSSVIDSFFKERTQEQTIDLRQVAHEAENHKDENARARFRELYGFSKSILGFTPDEITKGVTKHGVRFDPSQVDPSRVKVFRDRAELEHHWNNGNPTELFLTVGNKVADPENNLTSRQFYLWQAALLSTNQ